MPSKTRILASVLSAGVSVLAGPCDIYASGGTPCVAAHGTTRALYDRFDGALYQVTRGSDGATADIAPLSAGGVANAKAQDSFCAGTTCLISIIYDQSGRGNHISQAPAGAFRGPDVDGKDNLASAVGAPVTLNGKKAYGVFISPGTGYRNNAASGTAKGDEAQGMYAVMDGSHFNDQCCYDYGNAETSSTDTGNGHMEAIYYGDCTVWGFGTGNGPWVMADLENGLFSGQNTKLNSGNPSVSYRFVNTVVKGGPGLWAIKGGNATSGDLETFWNGARPTVEGYNPMSKEGAILLGIGGDNSNGAQGTFYEGCMTTGYPSDDIEKAVQANIVSAKYATTSLSTGPELSVGSSVSLRLTTPGFDTRYIAHSNSAVNTQVVTSSSDTSLKQQASWKVRAGFVGTGCFSFESVDTPGSFLRHQDFALRISNNDGSKQFKEDSTFCTEPGLDGKGTSFRAWSYPACYIRHYANNGYIARNGGVNSWDSASFFNDDVSYVVGASFA